MKANVAVNTFRGELADRTGGQSLVRKASISMRSWRDKSQPLAPPIRSASICRSRIATTSVHALNVQANRHGLKLYYRQSYYAGKQHRAAGHAHATRRSSRPFSSTASIPPASVLPPASIRSQVPPRHRDDHPQSRSGNRIASATRFGLDRASRRNFHRTECQRQYFIANLRCTNSSK